MNAPPPPPPPPPHRNGAGGERGNESLWKLVVRLFWDLMNRLLTSISRHLLIGEAQQKQTPFEKLCADLLRNDRVTKRIDMGNYYRRQHDHDVVTLGQALLHNTIVTKVTSLNFALLFPGYHEDMTTEDMTAVKVAAAPLLQFFRTSPSLRILSFAPYNRDSNFDGLVTLFSQAIAASSSIEDVTFSYNLCGEALCHLMGSSSLKTLDIGAAAPPSTLDVHSVITNTRLRQAIQDNSTLTTLKMDERVTSTVGNQILDHIATAQGCTGLRTLHVCGSFGVHLTSVSSVVSSPTSQITHLRLRYFQLNVTDVTELVDALITKPPLTSLKLEHCPFHDGTGRELARYMNKAYVVNGDDNDGSSNALPDLCIEFGNWAVPATSSRAAVPATFDADLTAMVHPIVSARSSQDKIGDEYDSPTITATIGSQLKILELGGVMTLVHFFGLLRDHALHIRLEQFRPRMIREDNVQAMVESIPHWVHVRSFCVGIVATQVDERPIVRALRRNGSLRRCYIHRCDPHKHGDSMVDSEKAKAYFKRNDKVPRCLANLPAAMHGGDPLGKLRQVPSLLVSMLPAEAMVPSTVLLGLSSMGQEAGVIA